MDGYERTAEIFKVLGHPVRLQIVEALRQDEACVCHLEALLGQRQAAISQHLMRLRGAGLVVDRRDGLNVYYALADDEIGSLVEAAAEAARRTTESALTFPAPSASACPCPKCSPEPESASITAESVK